MGIVVNMSAPAMDLALYGDRSNFLQSYLQQQMAQLGPSLNEFGQRIQNAMVTSYNFITDRLTQYGLRNELTQAGIAGVENYYVEINSWEELQQANITMQRFIMANPTMKQLYVDQNVDGYSDTYKPVDRKHVGEQDYDYRRVMSGVVQYGEGDEWFVREYHEELHPGDQELDHYTRATILGAWSVSDWLVDNCKFDFTCKSKEPVKINR